MGSDASAIKDLSSSSGDKYWTLSVILYVLLSLSISLYGDSIKPKKGSILMFPPMWMYLHRGNPVLAPGFAKYFLMTYLNYEPIRN